MHGSVLSRCVLGLLLGCMLVSCAARRHIRQGDKLLEAGRYQDAVAAYEEAVALAPDDGTAAARLRQARGLVAGSLLARVEQKLAAGDDLAALQLAAEVRSMPVDLEDVRLVRAIDRTVEKVAKRIDQRVSGAIQQGHYVRGVDLAEQVAQIVPKDPARRQDAERVSELAINHFKGLAAERAKAGLAGSAALQLALLQRVGGQVEAAEVARLWHRFAGPACFSSPKVTVTAKDEAAAALAATLEAQVYEALTSLLAYCDRGGRDLTVQLSLTSMSQNEETSSERAIKPLPGAQIQIEEVYEEQEPYTVMEEVTEYDTRVDKRQRRDCAPRPGKPRGCVTWVEDVEVKVPVKRMRAVQKVRRVEKRRPRTGPLPADKVLTYEVTTVTRGLAVAAVLTFSGMARGKYPIEVGVSSKDTTHDGAQGRGLVVPADPLQLESHAALQAQIATEVAKQVTDHLETSVRARGSSLAAGAAAAERKGRIPQAEELFLTMLALGARDEPSLDRFFQDRYGTPASEVARTMRQALGRGARQQRPDEATAPASAGHFPARSGDAGGPTERPARAFPTSAAAATVSEQRPSPAATPAGTTPRTKKEDAWATEGFSSDELQALEEASLEQESDKKQAEAARADSRKPTAPPAEAPPSDGAAPAQEPDAATEH